ncbi:Endonuclease/exonuclease/phosphatase [Calocera viscosa TUFC12733]|uniref:Endonuclease/exonuclease/phosphatase n=1 Tax=Calocera viscosa (strain TUFC12733) TaxID=1330018 RepID=A0A167P3C8_CALVF|nr:Endonuclease/exonuclease/phosphatase [Calocera viscosa TUFC12733]
MGSTTPREKQPYVPTPEQIQLANERKARRLAGKMQQAGAPTGPPDYSRWILPRKWLPVGFPSTPTRTRITIMTWNMLAQSLVRRELFPGSDCLKIKDREQMLSAEILHYDADIVCLQEVDRLNTLLPRLRDTYNNIYASGPGKLHGCMLLYRRSRFEEISSKVVYYDEESLLKVGTDGGESSGATRRTKNIGLIAALRFKDGSPGSSEHNGCLVATTHLFWHPRYTYERTRQAFILLREIQKFRSALQLQSWPVFIGGDFNSQPTEPTYSLLVGQQLLDVQKAELETSRVVHVSIDPTVGLSTVSGEEQEPSEAPSSLGNKCQKHRKEVPTKGLVQVTSRIAFREGLQVALRSVYDEARMSSDTFGQRHGLPSDRRGSSEAMWTSFTPLWRLTLDYIFVWDGVHDERHVDPRVLSVLAPHKTESLEPGLPRKGICASDHIALAAEVEW